MPPPSVCLFFLPQILESPLLEAMAADGGPAHVQCQTPISHGPAAVPAWHRMEVTAAARDRRRGERQEDVFRAPLKETKRDLEKLLKQMKQTNDKKHWGYFEDPINLELNPTYTAVVAVPTSRPQCAEKVARDEFADMGAAVAELRSVYANALLFCGPKEDQLSKNICIAAAFMAARWVHKRFHKRAAA